MIGTQQNIITIIVVYLFIINIDWFSLSFFFLLIFNFAPPKLKIWLCHYLHLPFFEWFGFQNHGLKWIAEQSRLDWRVFVRFQPFILA